MADSFPVIMLAANISTAAGERFYLKSPLIRHAFWEEFSLHPGQPFSTVAHVTELRGAVDEAALCRAITPTVAETQAFALRFGTRRGDRLPRLKRIDLQDHPDPYQAAMRLIQADAEQPMDLHTQPMAAVWLLTLGPTRYIWYLRAHHIIIDGYGMAFAVRAFSRQGHGGTNIGRLQHLPAT
ncbi:Dimodular nonribosomal peptide synthase [Serratia plymuthica]|nr:Dimodular nonribosomal peptide synthase [Serratia plymuthica]VEI16871.1 Dimodular nonribosomal peptide synthase [Serratia plymuthica]